MAWYIRLLNVDRNLLRKKWKV